MASNPRNKRDQRRLVHVPPSRMFGACQVIKRVTEIAITRRPCHVGKKIDSRDNCRHPKGKARIFCATCLRGLSHGKKQYQSKRHLRAVSKSQAGWLNRHPAFSEVFEPLKPPANVISC